LGSLVDVEGDRSYQPRIDNELVSAGAEVIWADHSVRILQSTNVTAMPNFEDAIKLLREGGKMAINK
jgi:hypothetical protein